MKSFTYFFILTALFSIQNESIAQDIELHNFYKNYWKMTQRSIQYLKKGEILVDSNVSSDQKKQVFHMKVAAVHPKKCSKVLRKLSLFESYKDWISFIKSSNYNKRQRLLTIKANHTLLPYPMVVHVIVKRPKSPGIYPFYFPTGIFAGLKGEMVIKDTANKCTFFSKSYWSGKKKLPDFAVELFSETLTQIAGSTLFRKIQ